MPTSPEPVEFHFDFESKKRGGVYRPIFSPIFSRESIGITRPSKVHLMINPYSGKKKGEKVALEAKKLLEESGILVETYQSSYPGHLIELSANITANK